MINQLTFTRFIAAISIVVFHFGLQFGPFNLPIIDVIFKNANIAVGYFFILSGFIMIISYTHKNSTIKFADFYLNRFARIFPLYFFALFITVVLLLFRYSQFKSETFLSLFLIQAWIPEYATSLNGPGWSLSVEMLFYFLFPFLFNFLYFKIQFKKLLFGVLLFWLISQVSFNLLYFSSFNEGYPSESHSFLHYFPLMHLNQFLIGNVTGLIFLKSKVKNYDFLIILLVFILCSIILAQDYFDISLNFHNGLLALLFAPLILFIASNNGKITTLFSGKVFIFLGEISYGVYILQVPIYLIVYYIGKSLQISHPELLFSIYLLFLLIFTTISYTFIEVPLRKIIRKNYQQKLSPKPSNA